MKQLPIIKCSVCGANLEPVDGAEIIKCEFCGTQQTINDSKISLQTKINNLLKRGNIALENGLWQEADNFFEQALCEDAEEAKAYIGKLMAEFGYRSEEDFVSDTADITESNNYKKAYRLADNMLKKQLDGYASAALYNRACAKMEKASGEDILHWCIEDYESAISIFDTILQYKDSVSKRTECLEKIEQCREASYKYACDIIKCPKTYEESCTAKSMFERLENYLDSPAKAIEAQNIADKFNTYKNAVETAQNAKTPQEMKKAVDNFVKLGDFCDSKSLRKKYEAVYLRLDVQQKEETYNRALIASQGRNKDELSIAISRFGQIHGYKDADALRIQCERQLNKITNADKLKNALMLIIALVVGSFILIELFRTGLFEAYFAYKNIYRLVLP